jgi:hypothetical protein
MEVSKTEARLNKLLFREGFDLCHPDPTVALKAFKAFAKETVECEEDLCFFHCGMSNNSGKSLYYLFFVRQFTIEEDCGWNKKVQLFIEFTCEPNKFLTPLSNTLWANESTSMEVFFRKIENSKEYKTAIIESSWKCKVYHKTVRLLDGKKVLCKNQ